MTTQVNIKGQNFSSPGGKASKSRYRDASQRLRITDLGDGRKMEINKEIEFKCTIYFVLFVDITKKIDRI